MSNAAPSAASRPRWRFTFRLSTLFVVITLAAFACAWPRLYRQNLIWQLREFVDRDLRKLSDEEQLRFRPLIRSLCPQAASVRSNDWPFQPTNLYLWQVSTDRGPRTLLFQGEMRRSMPGRSRAHLALFNGGEFLRQETFVTGYRSQILDAAIVKDRLLGEELIAVDTRGWSGANRYYALINDRPVLVRLEESDGELLTSEYPWSHVFSPPEPALTPDEWIRQLGEPRAARVLQALVWLGTRTDESSREDLVHQVVCRDPRTRAAVNRLTKHESQWVVEMAEMTLKKLPLGEAK